MTRKDIINKKMMLFIIAFPALMWAKSNAFQANNTFLFQHRTLYDLVSDHLERKGLSSPKKFKHDEIREENTGKEKIMSESDNEHIRFIEIKYYSSSSYIDNVQCNNPLYRHGYIIDKCIYDSVNNYSWKLQIWSAKAVWAQKEWYGEGCEVSDIDCDTIIPQYTTVTLLCSHCRAVIIMCGILSLICKSMKLVWRINVVIGIAYLWWKDTPN